MRVNKIVGALFFLLGAVSVIGILSGAVKIPLKELFLSENRPILSLRFLRIISAAVAGAGLAASGVALQAILRNPLAEPYLLGTSSGAGLGAVLALLFGFSFVSLPAAAFIGALLSIVLVYNLAKQHNKIPEHSLILSGVIVSVMLSAIIVFLVSISGNEALHGLIWWLWGSFQMYDAGLLALVTGIVLAGIIVMYVYAQDLNALSIGEEEALHLGVDIEKVKKILVAVIALVTAAIVCSCGIIGFVGLMIPHLMRLIVGPNHKVLIPTTCVAAAVFMVACDTLSRSIYPPYEIPIGVITAIIGAPVFIILFKMRQKI